MNDPIKIALKERRPVMDCVISIDLEAVANLQVTENGDSLEVNCVPTPSRKKPWTLRDIILYAAYEDRDSEGRGYAEWHSGIYVEAFEQVGPRSFRVEFGS